MVGVAAGERDGDPCIAVLVTEPTPDLPAAVEGYPLDIRPSGDLRAL